LLVLGLNAAVFGVCEWLRRVLLAASADSLLKLTMRSN
jgi:hypothetical protein